MIVIPAYYFRSWRKYAKHVLIEPPEPDVFCDQLIIKLRSRGYIKHKTDFYLVCEKSRVWESFRKHFKMTLLVKYMVRPNNANPNDSEPNVPLEEL